MRGLSNNGSDDGDDKLFVVVWLSGNALVLILFVVVWLSGNALVLINEVTLRRARLVLRWVTVSGVQLPVPENSISVDNQPPRSTQPSHPSVVNG